LKNSELLFSVDSFDEASFINNFMVKSGQWYVEDGWVVGKNQDMCPGMIISKQDFFGEVMLEITAKMVETSTHDINIMINGEWDDTNNCRGFGYVAGLEAFWHGNIGFEKSPEYKLTVATQLLDFDPTKEYNFKLGCVKEKCFVLVNDKLGLEIKDPDPINKEKYGKIGLEAFASWWKFKNLRVYKVKYNQVKEYYNPEF